MNSLNDRKFARVSCFDASRPYLRIETTESDLNPKYCELIAHFSGCRSFIHSRIVCDPNDINDIFEKFVKKEFLTCINLVPNLSIDPNAKFLVSIDHEDRELQFGAFRKHVVALCETVIASKV